MPTPARAPGLDTLRAAAIGLVFVYHYAVFVDAEPDLGLLAELGWTGVDLFFALSGYLIARQTFAGIAAGRTLSAPLFYARRALRTWPLFWVVLAFYFLFPDLAGGRPPPPLWRFLTYTQNLGLTPGTAFSHAWSLCIEEQFYLVFPLIVLAAGRLRPSGRVVGGLLVGGVALGIAVRCYRWRLYGSGEGFDQYYPQIYYATACRIDEFLPGIGLAAVETWRPGWLRRVDAHPVVAAGVVGLATAAFVAWAHATWFVEGVGYGFGGTTFGYSLLGALFAAIVAPLLVGAGPWGAFVGVTAVCLVVGFGLHHAIERPLLHVRDRVFPSVFARSGPAVRT